MGLFDTNNNVKCAEVRRLVDEQQYKKALETLEKINIDKVKSMADLNVFAYVYQKERKYEEARDILYRIYEKRPNKRVIYKLVYLAILVSDFEEAEALYQEYVEFAEGSVEQYILRYGLDKAERKDYQTRLQSLLKIKELDYTEEWAYELAKTYHKAGMAQECIDECSDIILWFGSGKIVEKATLLRAYYVDGADVLQSYGIILNEEGQYYYNEEAAKEYYKATHPNTSAGQDTQNLSAQISYIAEQQRQIALHNELTRDLEKTVDIQKAIREEMGNPAFQEDLQHMIGDNAGAEEIRYKERETRDRQAREVERIQRMEAERKAKEAEEMQRERMKKQQEAAGLQEEQMMPEQQMQSVYPERDEYIQSVYAEQDEYLQSVFAEQDEYMQQQEAQEEQAAAFEGDLLEDVDAAQERLYIPEESLKTDEKTEQPEMPKDLGEIPTTVTVEDVFKELDEKLDEKLEDTIKPKRSKKRKKKLLEGLFGKQIFEDDDELESEYDGAEALLPEKEDTGKSEDASKKEKPDQRKKDASEKIYDKDQKEKKTGIFGRWKHAFQKQESYENEEQEAGTDSKTDTFVPELTDTQMLSYANLREPQPQAEIDALRELEPKIKRTKSFSRFSQKIREREKNGEERLVQIPREEARMMIAKEEQERKEEELQKEALQKEQEKVSQERLEQERRKQKQLELELEQERQKQKQLEQELRKAKLKQEQLEKEKLRQESLEKDKLKQEQLRQKQSDKEKEVRRREEALKMEEEFSEDISNTKNLFGKLRGKSIKAKEENAAIEKEQNILSSLTEKPLMKKEWNESIEVPGKEKVQKQEQNLPESPKKKPKVLSKDDWIKKTRQVSQKVEKAKSGESVIGETISIKIKPKDTTIVIDGIDLTENFGKYTEQPRVRAQLLKELTRMREGDRPIHIALSGKDDEGTMEFIRSLGKAIKTMGVLPTYRIASIDAEKLNRIQLVDKQSELKNGCVAVRNAGKITADTAQSILNMIEEFGDNVIIILVDQYSSLDFLMTEYPALARYFTYNLTI